MSVCIKGICDIQNIFYYANLRKIAEEYENIHSAKHKNKYQMLFCKNKLNFENK